MRKWMGLAVILVGCDGLADQESEGVALATLHGTLLLGADVEPPASNLRVSVLWRDPAFGSLHEPGVISVPSGRETFLPPGPCADGQPTGWRLETGLLEQPGRLSTAFPSGFSVELSEPPPAAALFDYPDGSGVSVARGDLVVYDDRNGNDRLDPSTFDAMSPDVVFGSGLGPAPWGVGQRKHYNIVYLTGNTALQEGDSKAGYSIETDEYNAFGVSMLSAQRLSDAMIELTLDPSTYAQQLACTVMCKASNPEDPEDPKAFLAGDLGVRLPSELETGTSVWSRQDGAANMLTLARCYKDPASGGGGALYTLDLSVVRTQGCTETTSFQITVVRTASDADYFPIPCAQVSDADRGFPMDAPR